MSWCTCRLRSDLNFGKYRGKKVSAILESDPQYLVWAFGNTNCHPSQEVIDALKQKGFEVTVRSKAGRARLRKQTI